MSNALDSVRAAYAAFATGDVPAVLGTLAPDVHWTEAEGGPYGGVSIGPDAVLQNVFMKLGSEWQGFAAVPREFVASGDTVVALGEYRCGRRCWRSSRSRSSRIAPRASHASRS
jgi:uncharacterized protein